MIKKEKKFRLKGKKLFLTYPQIDSSVESLKEKVLNQLTQKIRNINTYIISEEKHEDGGVHIHCFLELSRIYETTNVNLLDLTLEDKEYHGNYQIGKKKNSIIEYLIKDSDFITNMNLPIKNGKILSVEEHLFDICKEEGFFKAKECLFEKYSKIAVKKGTTLLKNLESFNQYNMNNKNIENNNKKLFQINDFDKLEQKNKLKEIQDWIKKGVCSGFKLTFVLHGPGGTGKTLLAKAIFDILGIDYLTVSQINDFKSFDSSRHKGILIDDMDAESLSRLEILNIIDSSQGKSIRVLYGIVPLIPDIPKIITTNNLNDYTKNGTKELVRRLKTIKIPEEISSKFNINIQINIHNNNNNNYFGDSLGISKEKLNNILKKFDKKEDL